VTSGDCGSGGAGFFDRFVHGVVGALVDEGADESVGFAWVADVDGGIDFFELGDELVVDAVVDDEAA